MFSTMGQLLPGFVCLALTVYYIASRAVKRNPYYVVVSLSAAVFFICDAGFILTSDNYKELIVVEFFSHFASTALAPTIFFFLHYENTGKRPPKWTYISFLPSIVIGSISAICILGIGTTGLIESLREIESNNYIMPQGWEGLHKIYYINNIVANRLIMGLYELFLLGHSIYLCALRIRKRDGSGKRMLVICSMMLVIISSHMLKLSIDRTTLIEMEGVNAIMGVIWAICIAVIGHDYTTRPSSPVPQELANIPKAVRKATLMEQVLDIMDNCKYYLKTDISLNSLADELGTNRTYLSALINKEFNCTFRELITKKRIEYAKSYMLANPKSTITEVAEASGFANISQFSRKFKEAEGISPATWLKKL